MYRLPSHIDFKKCKEEVASALNDFGKGLYKRESVECNALKEWKLSGQTYKIKVLLILFSYLISLNLLFDI